jgi:lipid-binding SYLF domain-containing protein
MTMTSMRLLSRNRQRSLLAAVLALAGLVAPGAVAAEGLQGDVNQATSIVERFRSMPEKQIPPKILADAKGLAIMSVVKAGFLVSAQGGTGVVIARTGKGWSGPSAIGTGGAGFGFQVGAQVTEFLIVLNTPAAVEAFSHGGNVAIGADLSAAVGPVGRDLSADVMPTAAIYTYSLSQGLFAGMSLEGTVIVARNDANDEYYGRSTTPQAILSGRIAPPSGADRLRSMLSRL